MATANREIKARQKANPDRIQADIRNARVIRAGEVLDNDMLHVAETETLTPAELPDGNISVPLSLWLEYKASLQTRGGIVAVQIASDEVPADLLDDLETITMIVLPFVNFVDGRGYSHAHRLRTQYGFSGEIRAVGDVHFDQLDFLARCGVDSFELPNEDDHQAALRAFTEFSEVYQPAADDGRLVFARRRKIH